DAPEQDAMLVDRGNGEVAKDDQEDEQIIDGQRFFDQVASEEFDRFIGARVRFVGMPEVPESPNSGGKQASHANPDDTPNRRLAHGDDVRPTLQDAQIEGEHEDDEYMEADENVKLGGLEPRREACHGGFSNDGTEQSRNNKRRGDLLFEDFLR